MISILFVRIYLPVVLLIAALGLVGASGQMDSGYEAFSSIMREEDFAEGPQL